VLPEDSTQFASQKFGTLSAVRTTCYTVRTPHQTSSVRTTWIPIRTFLCVEKLRIAPACIRPDDSAAHPNDSQCSIKLQDFFPKHRYRKIAGKNRNSNPDVRTRVHQIWKLRASNQLSGRPSSWSGRVKPLYGNYLQRTYDRSNDTAPPSGQLIAHLSVRTAHDYRPDGAQFLSSQTLI